MVQVQVEERGIGQKGIKQMIMSNMGKLKIEGIGAVIAAELEDIFRGLIKNGFDEKQILTVLDEAKKPGDEMPELKHKEETLKLLKSLIEMIGEEDEEA